MNGIKVVKREQVYFDDVEVGDEVPPLIKTPYNLGKMALWAAVHGDFCAGHFDYRTAEERFHTKRPFAYGLHIATYLGQLMTDWIGPNGMLKKFKSQTRANVLDKDRIVVKGKITKKYTENNDNYVDCEIWAENQDRVTVAKGAATVILPSRSA
jgi:acyl dehydratase